jgi:hypothetical protein
MIREVSPRDKTFLFYCKKAEIEPPHRVSWRVFDDGIRSSAQRVQASSLAVSSLGAVSSLYSYAKLARLPFVAGAARREKPWRFLFPAGVRNGVLLPSPVCLSALSVLPGVRLTEKGWEGELSICRVFENLW